LWAWLIALSLRVIVEAAVPVDAMAAT